MNEAPVGGLWTQGGSSELTPAVLRSGIALWNKAICLCWAVLGQHPSACQKIGPLFEPDVQKRARRIPILPLSLPVSLSLPSFALGLLPIPPLPPHPPSPVPWWRWETLGDSDFSGRESSSLAARPSLIPCLDVGTAGRLNRCSPLFDFSAFELILSAQLLKQLSPPAASHFRLDLTHSASLRQSPMTYTHSHRLFPGPLSWPQSDLHTHVHTQTHTHKGNASAHLHSPKKILIEC